MKRILCSLLVAAVPFGSVLADAPKSKNVKVTLVYQHELPNVPGKSIKGVLVEYGPGGYSPAHTHPKSAFIYATVLEGAIRSQVNDGPVTTYKAGQSFSELPGDRHGVSANASQSKPAKLLAVFVVDTNETELTIPFGNRGLLPFVRRYCRGDPTELLAYSNVVQELLQRHGQALLSGLSAGRRGDSAMARTYRDSAIEEMLGTTRCRAGSARPRLRLRASGVVARIHGNSKPPPGRAPVQNRSLL